MTDDATSDECIQCEYQATADDAGVRGVHGEEIEGNVVYCTAEADVVLRPTGLSGLQAARGPGPAKGVFCKAHADFLRREKTQEEKKIMGDTPPRDWEQCGESPELVRGDATK